MVNLLLINDGQLMEEIGLSPILEKFYYTNEVVPVICVAIHAGTERTGRIVRPQFFKHQFVDRRPHDPIVVPVLLEVGFDEVGMESRESGMDRDRNKRKADRRPLPEPRKDTQQGPTVLAARQRNEDPVVVPYQPEIADGLASKLPNASFAVIGGDHG